MNYNEIVYIINKLNCEIYDKLKHRCFNVELTTNGNHTIIRFIDIILYHSSDEDRSFNEIQKEYEPMEPYLRRKLNKELSNLNKLKF